MRALKKTLLASAAGVLLFSLASPMRGETTQDPAERGRSMARHFAERPPVLLEILHTADQQPRMVITNHHQYPLTAFIVRTDPTAANTITNTLVFDGLTRMGLLAPIPRGLSFVTGVPHPEGQSVPDPVLAAAVWEDGSTYGPDELLVRISKTRSALADSYDRAITMLQSGLDKNWTAADYCAAAQQLRSPLDATLSAIPEASVAGATPIRTIALNMDRIARQQRSAKILNALVRTLLTHFTEERDALRQALARSSPAADTPKAK
jgi:hypothetical protein